ncbi:tumor necrosis factor alpha-induced protein 2 [Ochotona princeps]|uniref:tumor necrosis factor alpha-induced protein 2 n=1 Tax=Ochotona princeps TaxID=9978 RepID=UPI00271549EC|nr:tumor necrosis factor alpha-induced protein 2 [Ochotona princeps]
MLKIMTFLRDPLGQQSVPGVLDFLGSPQKLRSTSEASMSEASSGDLVPQDKEEERTAKKKPKTLASMFSVFTKGKKKKKQGQSSSAESTGQARPGLQGPPPTVEELKATLEHGQLEAAWPLLELERELQAAAAAGGTSAEELVRRQSKVEALYVLLRDQVLGVLRRPLDVPAERLRLALAVLAEQEREDAQVAAEPAPGAAALAPTRPRGWLQLWRRGVAEVAAERLGQRPAAGSTDGRSEAESAFLHMGRTMKEDLETVAERLKPLFPAELGVMATYARCYHEHFAAHLAALTEFELCERDTYMLLVWVQNFYPNDILSSPKLAGELQGLQLGSLLPPRQIQVLETAFLSNEVANIKELMARALEVESQRWAEGAAPQRLDGRCHSELAIDVLQIVSQGQTKAERITPELGSVMKQILLAELTNFLQSYQASFNDFLEQGRQLGNYRANVMANINNCLSFRTSMEQNWQIPRDPPSHLLAPLNELKSRGFNALLQTLFLELKPLFKRLTQTRWAAAEEILEAILGSMVGRLPEFLELHDCFREELMETVHLHLVKEYITRLCKRRLVLKTAEQQQQLARHVLANAELIHGFCTQNGSPAAWLHHALPTLAEIIRLQDPSAIKIEVAMYATWYPDFSKGHLSAILAIKGNLSSSEARSIRNILDVNTGVQESSRSLFSLINVG